jgi:hypothetical protein
MPNSGKPLFVGSGCFKGKKIFVRMARKWEERRREKKGVRGV